MILVTGCFASETRAVSPRPNVRIVRTEIGDRSPRALDPFGDIPSTPSHLIATGFCGGVNPRIARGELVLARAIRHRSEEIVVDPRLLQRVETALAEGRLRPHVGVCHCADHVVDRSEKRALAGQGIAAVDMESGPLARWALARRIPFVALRIVLDSADEPLPFSSEPPWWRTALLHPVTTSRIARAAIQQGRTLGKAVDTVVDALGGSDG